MNNKCQAVTCKESDTTIDGSMICETSASEKPPVVTRRSSLLQNRHALRFDGESPTCSNGNQVKKESTENDTRGENCSSETEHISKLKSENATWKSILEERKETYKKAVKQCITSQLRGTECRNYPQLFP